MVWVVFGSHTSDLLSVSTEPEILGGEYARTLETLEGEGGGPTPPPPARPLRISRISKNMTNLVPRPQKYRDECISSR